MTTRPLHALVLAGSLLVASCASSGSKSEFTTPQAAADAFVDALRQNDLDRLEEILGSEGQELLSSGDEVDDRSSREDFVAAWDVEHDLIVTGNEAVIVVGHGAWPLPLPIVHAGDTWGFDAERGKDEVLSRRIGRNELATIEVCRAIADAQQEYAAADHGRGSGEYAAKIVSAAGKKDGLYWPTAAGEEESPLGPLAAEAAMEGYTKDTVEQGKRPAYHGYYFRILTAQGPNGSGGARSYIVDGRMTGGYALLAEPATYGNSGVMTFLVGPFGIVYQRDLGPDTSKLAKAITAFDPGPEWTIVED